jgi:hypothetical protein
MKQWSLSSHRSIVITISQYLSDQQAVPTIQIRTSLRYNGVSSHRGEFSIHPDDLTDLEILAKLRFLRSHQISGYFYLEESTLQECSAFRP